MTERLIASELSLGYPGRLIVDELSLDIPTGKITVLIGPNACGKSTLLRGLARLLKPGSGSVLLDGGDIATMPSRQVAKVLGLLPQSPIAPEGVTVGDIVARGRYPHQAFLRRWSTDDELAVERALDRTGTLDLKDRLVDELSGGQRQRAWIAMALAQETDIVLLDEPTTYLDLSYQIEVLDLLAELNEHEGRTIVLVLHELNLAFRYAHHLVAMRSGAIVAQGSPHEIVTKHLLRSVFDLDCMVMTDPMSQAPMCLPAFRQSSRSSSQASGV